MILNLFKKLDWSNVIENTLAGLTVLVIAAIIGIIFSKKFRSFLLKLLSWVLTIIRRNYIVAIGLAIVIVAEFLLYNYYKSIEIVILSLLHVVFIAIFFWFLFKKPFSHTKSKPFTIYPFSIMVGLWDLTFGPNNSKGFETAKIDNDGNYFVGAKLVFRLKELRHNITANEISYNKVQTDGKKRQRDILRITNSNLLEGYKEGKPEHKLIYKRHGKHNKSLHPT